MSFPEEPLNLSPSEGGGYYPAAIHQKLNGGKYEIVRKLGYGPRSSTWLVLQAGVPQYFAVKIFTIAASDRARTVDLPIIKATTKLEPHHWLGIFYGSFWEGSSAGSHLCFVMYPFSTSVRVLRGDAVKKRLPVYVVQKIVATATDTLVDLHNAGIMHGAIKADNIFFCMPAHLRSTLGSERPPTAVKVKNYTTIRSQPLNHDFKWNDKFKKVAEWPISLDNFGHAQQWNYKPEKQYDYSSAPETLLQQASCSPQTDIWMLGYMTFELLTGNAPFPSNGKVSKQVAAMCSALGHNFPGGWLGDDKLKYYNPAAYAPVTSIDAVLAGVLNPSDAAAATAFIKGCLRLDPKNRLTAEDCSCHRWLAKIQACSCCY